MPKLTKRLVEAIEPEEKDIIIRDSELKGFICKVTPKNKRVYMLYYRTKDGRERKPAIGNHGALTCEDAREIAREWLSDIAKGGDPSLTKQKDKSTPTVEEFSKLYLEKHAPNMKPKSAEEDERLWRNYVVPALGKIKINVLGKHDLISFHQSLRHKTVTANRAIGLLSRALNIAESWGMRPENSNPCKYVKKYAEKKKERFLSLDELSNLSKTLSKFEKNETVGLSTIYAIRLLIFTGCRLNEILTLKWSYVDFDNHCLRLPDSKTGAKTVYLAPAALEVLSNLPRQEFNPYVIPGKIKGARLVNLQKPWRKIRKDAKLDDVRIHDLRHSFASIGAASGLSLPIIGALLGHKQTQTTARYAHLVGDPLKQAAGAIGDRIKAAMEQLTNQEKA